MKCAASSCADASGAALRSALGTYSSTCRKKYGSSSTMTTSAPRDQPRAAGEEHRMWRTELHADVVDLLLARELHRLCGRRG